MKEVYKKLFRVSEEDLDSVIAAALSRGGDYADLFFENFYKYNYTLCDSKVTYGGLLVDYGVGIRTLCGIKTGYSYCERSELKTMIQTAKTAALIASGEAVYHYEKRNHPPVESYPQEAHWRNYPTQKAVRYLQKLENRVRELDSRSGQINISLEYQHRDIMMYNSLRELRCDSRPMLTLNISAVFAQNGEKISQSTSRSYRCDSDVLNDALIEEVAQELTQGVTQLFTAQRPKGGEMSVVMGAGTSGILLHEAMGHAFEADFNITGESIFSDKMGQRVAPKGINIVDDGTCYGNRGACRYDDEGIEGQKTYMVRDGILHSYLHDRLSAARYGVAPTGNGRRQNFTYAPIPRMRNTYMENGDCHPEDIIRSVKKGIYVDKFSNGQVKIGEGDFTFYVKSGYLIEDGKLCAPIKDINIIGNGPQTLANIQAVGNDLQIPDVNWTCGKGQSVPVSCGVPTLLISSLTVGGN